MTVGAHVGTRTRDLLLTKEVLCQLSYMGLTAGGAVTPGTGNARAHYPCVTPVPRDDKLYREKASTVKVNLIMPSRAHRARIAV